MWELWREKPRKKNVWSTYLNLGITETQKFVTKLGENQQNEQTFLINQKNLWLTLIFKLICVAIFTEALLYN